MAKSIFQSCYDHPEVMIAKPEQFINLFNSVVANVAVELSSVELILIEWPVEEFARIKVPGI